MLQIIKREGLYGSGGEYLPLFSYAECVFDFAGMETVGVSDE